MAPEVFLDTAYAVALSSRHDRFHERAMQLAGEIRTAGVRLVTSRAIVLEIGNALSRRRYREAAIRLLEGLEADPRLISYRCQSRFISEDGSYIASDPTRNGA